MRAECSPRRVSVAFVGGLLALLVALGAVLVAEPFDGWTVSASNETDAAPSAEHALVPRATSPRSSFLSELRQRLVRVRRVRTSPPRASRLPRASILMIALLPARARRPWWSAGSSLPDRAPPVRLV